MERRPTFTLRYLMLLILCWAVVFALIREMVDQNRNPDYRFLCWMLLPLALGPAYGGSVLKMRFGLRAGVWIFLAHLVFRVLIGSDRE